MAYHPKWMIKPTYDANEDNLVDDADKVDGADAGTAANNVFKIPADIAQGDIFYVDGSGNIVRLPAGSAGQFLQTQGAGANPQWASPPSGVDAGIGDCPPTCWRSICRVGGVPRVVTCGCMRADPGR